MIPNDFIQTLLARVDIVEVIDRSVPLKKAGANFAACCPFHTEKSPSFTVSPSKQFYHCFGCGAHGTAISFLMEYGGKPFPEAVEELARDAGLEVPRATATTEFARRDEGQDHGAALLQAARFYRAALKDAPRAIDYLKGRGLTGAIAARFGIGYAPDDWQPLAAAFSDYQDKVLETSGLVLAGDGGKRYDRFRDRIMFPIHDGSGRIIGFGGRVIDKRRAEVPQFAGNTVVFQGPRALRAVPGSPRRAQRRQGGRGRRLHGRGCAGAARCRIRGGHAGHCDHGDPCAESCCACHRQRSIFCFDGDAAGQTRGVACAGEHTWRVLADGKNGALSVPAGRRRSGRLHPPARQGGFRDARGSTAPHRCPIFMVCRAGRRVMRRPPTEARAALISAAKPLLAAACGARSWARLICRRLGAIAELARTSGYIELASLQCPPRPRPGSAQRGNAALRATIARRFHDWRKGRFACCACSCSEPAKKPRHSTAPCWRQRAAPHCAAVSRILSQR